jgi:spore coat polysaccharide biosynthesis protein SpsF
MEMKTVAIIQARMGSTRLPGKIMMDLGGDTVLARVVRRVSRATLIEKIVVATTHNAADDTVVRECDRLGVACFRGSEDNVLDRYYRAAIENGAEAVVRITSDCPMIEPEISDSVVRGFLEKHPDYASNTVQRTYPRGLDTEVMTFAALAKSWTEGTQPYERTHVTPYLYLNPQLFQLLHVTDERDYSQYRWTVDTPEDLAFVRAVYDRLGNVDTFHWRDVLSLLDREPQLLRLNQHIVQKALREC